MREVITLDLICPHCTVGLRPAVKRCPQCGHDVSRHSGDPTGTPSVADNWADHPAIVLGMLFLVLAALGLPWLWRSRGFSKRAKWFWTLVILIYTALLLWLIWMAIGYLVVQIEALRAVW